MKRLFEWETMLIAMLLQSEICGELSNLDGHASEHCFGTFIGSGSCSAQPLEKTVHHLDGEIRLGNLVLNPIGWYSREVLVIQAYSRVG